MSQYAVSIDLETLAIRNDAPIIAIGACFFNYDGSPWEGLRPETFEAAVNPVGQPAPDAETVLWWTIQTNSQALYESQFGEKLGEALRRLNDWLGDFGGEVWVRGNKDSVWLESAYARHPGIEPAFHFLQFREQRTLLKFATDRGLEKPERWTEEHDALDDAKYQAECIQAVYKMFPLKE